MPLRFLQIIMILSLLSPFSSCTKKNPTFPQLYVSSILGSATVVTSGVEQNLREGMFLANGDVIRTGPNTRVRLILKERGIITLVENTLFDTSKVTGNNEELKASFTLNKGGMIGVLKKLGQKDNFQVKATTVILSVRGTSFLLTTDGNGLQEKVEAAVLTGVVTLTSATNASSVTKLEAMQELSVSNGLVHDLLPKPLSPQKARGITESMDQLPEDLKTQFQSLMDEVNAAKPSTPEPTPQNSETKW